MAAWIGTGHADARATETGMSERTCGWGCWAAARSAPPSIRMLHEHADDIAMRAGCRVEVTRVAVRDLDRDRDVPLPREAFTTDGVAIVDDPDIDVVCEVIGGVEPAKRARCCGRSRTGSRWSPPTRSCSRTRARTCSTRPTPPGSTCCSRPPWPAASRSIRPLKESLAGERVAPHARHRERHDELHPHPDDRARVVVRRRARRGAAARLRRGRPDRRRRGLRRRREVRRSSRRSRSTRASSRATSTARGSPASRRRTSPTRARMGYVVKLLAIAELDDERDLARACTRR